MAKRAPVQKKKVTKKKATKKVTKKAGTTKKKTKRSPAKKVDPKQLDLETELEAKKEVPEKPAPPARGKKTPPKKGDKLFSKLIEVRISEAIAVRMRVIHEAMGNENEFDTLTAVVETGLEVLEAGITPKASGNLVDNGEDGDFDEAYDPEFEEAFEAQVSGVIG